VNGGRFIQAEHKALPSEELPPPELEVRPGDLLMSRANTRELLGSVAMVPEGCRRRLLLCDKLFRLVLNPNAFDGRFLVYAMAAASTRAQLESEATGSSPSMQNIGQGSVKDLLLPHPSLPNQRAIAEFLDRKMAAIDALIAEKEHLLAVLLERRRAVVTQAVTRGLNPEADFKSSRAGWPESIPAHWSIKRIKHAARLESGHTPDRSEPKYWQDTNDIPWVSLSDTKWLAENDYISDTALHVNQ
jgi:type I restriction enzyme S subunit